MISCLVDYFPRRKRLLIFHLNTGAIYILKCHNRVDKNKNRNTTSKRQNILTIKQTLNFQPKQLINATINSKTLRHT